ncbi:hypothetical protein N0V91_004604 [Didymella pomorum]|uniref:Uncharacterized protein n=1 Tax=Didymella pomorum TaxID=749634 RepID=A0A9W8ZGA9_9PLEO|nr:hypothetical protein N0V91_004604 [Didymella pomorum]
MPAVTQHQPNARQSDMQQTTAPPAKHKRFASLLRLPSSSSRKDKDKETPPASSPRLRRATTNPPTPNTPNAPAQNAPSASASYFSPQPGASGSGIDNSRGPPVTLITRGNSDYARKKAPATTPNQPQRQHSGLPTPIADLQRMDIDDDDDDDDDTSSTSEATASIPAANKPMLSRQSTVTSVRSSLTMPKSREPRDDPMDIDDTRSMYLARNAKRTVSKTETEDLFLNIAEDNAPKRRAVDAAARQDRLRSRIARVNNRHSTPSGTQYSSPVPAKSTYGTPTTSRLPFTSSTDPKSSALPRRTTALPTPVRTSFQSFPPNDPSPRTRLPELNAKASFSSRRDAELSPSEFLASMRRPSVPDTLQTPPKRASTHAYRPSNLSYTPVRKEPVTPQSELRQEAPSQHETESQGSTGPAASVWDELDELKNRIKKIELGGGKTPATSNAAVAQASAERPRTANTAATTVSSSPHQLRKPSGSPSESTVETSANRVHPLLKDALAKAKQHTAPSVYRTLEATATEAIALAELAGTAVAAARRPSVQVNGESPKATRDGDDTGSVISSSFSGVSPSRALERIEARRTSMLAASTSKRPTSRDTNGSNDPVTASRVQRASTSMNRARRQSAAGSDTEEDEDDTLRAPSRAMTDFRQLRSINTNTSAHINSNNSSFEKNRHSRTYTSQEPMPELQPSPKFQATPSSRRPTVTGVPNENSLIFRDSPRRFNFDRQIKLDRQSSPAIEQQTVNGLRERLQLGANRTNPNRNTIGTTTDLSRSTSLGRTRVRGASTSFGQ